MCRRARKDPIPLPSTQFEIGDVRNRSYSAGMPVEYSWARIDDRGTTTSTVRTRSREHVVLSVHLRFPVRLTLYGWKAAIDGSRCEGAPPARTLHWAESADDWCSCPSRPRIGTEQSPSVTYGPDALAATSRQSTRACRPDTLDSRPASDGTSAHRRDPPRQDTSSAPDPR